MKMLTVLALVLAIAYAGAHYLIAPALDANMNQVTGGEYPVSEQANALHASLFIADMHSDTTLWQRDPARHNQRGHVDLPRLRQGNVALQVFSATTKSPRGQNYDRNEGGSDNVTALAVIQAWPVSTWYSLYARADYQLDRLLELAEREQGSFIFIDDRADLQRLLEARAKDPDVVGGMYLIEGAHPLEGDIDNLDRLRAKGLHFVGLTHFFDNRLGGSLHGISGEGLTEFGSAVVRRAHELGMTIDVAHASPQMVRDVLDIADRPVVLSHGGFAGACDTPRNLPDELMIRIAEGGGIIGVGYWDAAVCDPSPAGIARSIRYGIELLGVEHIALGSDYDGTVTTPFDTAGLAALTQALLDEGLAEEDIRAVMGGSMLRFLQQQLPES
jgi:microsomal dipeptidase-like Zn-dependent dipeptidase